MIAKANRPSFTIPAILDEGGKIKRTTLEIVNVFKGTISTAQINVEGEMWDIFKKLKIPSLSKEVRDGLEGPLTLEELQRATADMANQKSLGLDGLPVEIYKRYGGMLLPKLLKVFNWVAGEEKLPLSMTEATIFVLPKEGKNQLETASYRPISLLCSDVKILAKVLAARLIRIISKLIHSDQTGFIPDRSVNANIRRVYLNIQLPIDSHSQLPFALPMETLAIALRTSP